MRKKRYIYGLISSLISQFITIISGIILPRVLIAQFGSEVYGATSSITQFLGYIVLLEGGIGGVARAALYKPLAEKNHEELSRVVSYVRHFFQIIAYIFVGYTLVIACFYKYIARNNSFEWIFSFVLVIVISLSSLAQYYFGIAYIVLLQADQKGYVRDILNAATLAVNTMIACLLASKGANIIIVKLAWCGGHLIRIAILNLYIKHCYRLTRVTVQKNYLPQKWDGLGQHIAYFLHSHTDVIVLTILVNLQEVSVYSIYNYIASSINTMVSIAGTNMESIFGDMLARNETNRLNDFFDMMEYIINSCIIICFSTAFSLIMPFVLLYTKGLSDADYYRPILAGLMLFAQMLYCFRQPYHQLTIAAGHFRKTKNAAFIEAAMNIFLSCLLCIYFGAEGVIIATVLSIAYRGIYYIFYIKKNIISRNSLKAVKRFLITIISICINIAWFNKILSYMGEIRNYGQWILIAGVFVLLSVISVIIGSIVFYKRELFLVKDKIIAIAFTNKSC
ncbi:MAG: polysaccharide biosynthesis C-terminal domain-containing protein [Roseburia sp.]|nr:polysaccharide biosynthesis C-terminal domain-containing protein [Roseburia sp.]